MLEVILLKVMLEKLSEETNLRSVITTFTDHQAEVEWDLTMKCNYACTYCVSYNNSDPTHFRNLQDYESSINYLKEYFNNKKARISLLGGEPMLYKQWDSLLNTIFEIGFIPKIITNLAINTKTLEKKIKNLKPERCIDVSWHPQFADEQQILSKIQLISESGHLRSLSILGDIRYWDKVVSARKQTDYLDNVEISFIKDEAKGKNIIASKLTEYSKEQIEYIKESTKQDNKKKYNTEIVYKNGTSKRIASITEFFSEGITNFKGMYCDVGQLRLHIKPTGDVFPSACLLNYPKAKMGNIFEKNIIKPVNPIKCPFTFCGCGPDQRINKYV